MVKKIWWVLLFLLYCSFVGQVFAEDTQTIGRQWLQDTAEAAIRQYSGVKSGNLSIGLLSLARDVAVPQGNVELVTEIPSGVKYNMPTVVYINVMVDGRQEARVLLRFGVKLYQNVVVAARALAVHEQISAECLRYERLDVGRLAPGFLTDMNKVIGLQVRNSLQPGMVLTAYILDKPVIIARGSTVSTLARAGNLEVSTVGTVMQDGALGQIIRVQNANSRKFMSAKVLDEATVLVTSFNGK
jgi:flagella basal body P-ring formation protein FlgA